MVVVWKLTGGEDGIKRKKLRFIMARKEVGVRELAEKAGISAAAVSRYTRGTKPSIKSLSKIPKCTRCRGGRN